MHLIETGNFEVNADGDPNLGLHGILAGAEKRFDTKVLLDPFEEQFDLPAALVKVRDAQGRKFEMVGQEDQILPGFGVEEVDAPQLGGVAKFAFGTFEADALVATKPRFFVHRTGLADVVGQVAFGTRYEECPGLTNEIESAEIDVSTIHDVDALWLESELVEHVHIVDASVCNADEYGDRASQVHQRVQLDSGLGLSEIGPREEAQAQVDGAGIQGVNHLLDIQIRIVFGTKPPCPADEYLSQIGINTPVAVLVGVGQVGAGDVAAKAHRVKMRGVAQAGLDVAQTLPESHLRKGHRQELIACGEGTHGTRHRVSGNAALELLAVHRIHNLRENRPTSVHPLLRMETEQNGDSAQMRHTPLKPQASQIK